MTPNWRERARQYAESQMPSNWDRKDDILIGIFYKYMIDFIDEHYTLIEK